MSIVKLLTISLFLQLATACNLYDASRPDTEYLCADQKCSIEGGKSLQCQSGCCHEGKCNSDGACTATQFYISLGAIIGVFVVGLGAYFLFWYFRCRTKDPKNNLRFVDGADERPLAAGDEEDD